MKIKNLKINKRVTSLLTAFTLMFSSYSALASNSDYHIDDTRVSISEGMNVSKLDSGTIYFDGENIAINFNGNNLDIDKFTKNKHINFNLNIEVCFSDSYDLSSYGDYHGSFVGSWITSERRGVDKYNTTGFKTINGDTFKIDINDFRDGVIKFENLYGINFDDFMKCASIKEGQPYFLRIVFNTNSANNMDSINYSGVSPIYYYYNDDKCASSQREDSSNIDFDYETGMLLFKGLSGTDGNFLDIIVNGENISLSDPYTNSGIQWYGDSDLLINLNDKDIISDYGAVINNYDECVTPRILSYMEYYFGYYDDLGNFIPGRIKDGDEFMIAINSYGYYSKKITFDGEKYRNSIRNRKMVRTLNIDINNPFVFDIETHSNCTGVNVRIYNSRMMEYIYDNNFSNGHIDLMGDFDSISNNLLTSTGTDFVIEVCERTSDGDYNYRSGYIHYYVDNFNSKFNFKKK